MVAIVDVTVTAVVVVVVVALTVKIVLVCVYWYLYCAIALFNLYNVQCTSVMSALPLDCIAQFDDCHFLKVFVYFYI